jgi:hypothetical protein
MPIIPEEPINNNGPIPISFSPIPNPQADMRVAHLRINFDGNNHTIINGHNIKHMQCVSKTTKLMNESL